MFAIPNYYQNIKNYLASPSIIDEERKNELKEIINNNQQIVLSPTMTIQQKNKILKLLDQLLEIKPGIELIDRIVSHQQIITIEHSSSHPYNEKNHIYLNLDKTGYCLGVEVNHPEKIDVIKTKKAIILAHEFIHTLHHLEETQSVEKKPGQLLDPQYDNIEEQHTITGLQRNALGRWTFDPLCENTFNIHFFKNYFRVFHRSILVKKQSIPTLSERIFLISTTGHIKTFLKDHPDALNTQQYVQYKDINKTMRPLTAAICSKNWTTFNFLLTQDSLELNYQDEVSKHPIIQLLRAKEYEQALKIASDPRCNIGEMNQKTLDYLIKTIVNQWLESCSKDDSLNLALLINKLHAQQPLYKDNLPLLHYLYSTALF